MSDRSSSVVYVLILNLQFFGQTCGTFSFIVRFDLDSILNNSLVPSNCTNIMSFCTVDNPRLITRADNLLLTIWGIHYRTIQNTYRYLVVSDPFIIVRVMVFNTTFNNISVLLVEETRVPRENHWVTESFINFPIAFIVNFVIWCWMIWLSNEQQYKI
jgi:hypothetical protein